MKKKVSVRKTMEIPAKEIACLLNFPKGTSATPIEKLDSNGDSFFFGLSFSWTEEEEMEIK